MQEMRHKLTKITGKQIAMTFVIDTRDDPEYIASGIVTTGKERQYDATKGFLLQNSIVIEQIPNSTTKIRTFQAMWISTPSSLSTFKVTMIEVYGVFLSGLVDGEINTHVSTSSNKV